MEAPRGNSPSLRRKRKLCFSPSPQVHEYDTESPSKRRLEVSRYGDIEAVDSEALKFEMEARGLGNPRLIAQRNLLKKAVLVEMQDELARYGLYGQHGTLEELTEMLQLVKYLRRRAHIRLADLQGKQLNGKMPADLCSKVLCQELEKRRIEVPRERRNKIVALEEALLKEDEGKIGDGYDFGRRFLNIDEILETDSLSDKDLRECLGNRGVANIPRRKVEKAVLLKSLVEQRLEESLQDSFLTELADEIYRRGELASLLEQHPHLSKVIARLKARHTGPRKCRKNSGVNSDVDIAFSHLHRSGSWKNDYEEVEENESRASCMIS